MKKQTQNKIPFLVAGAILLTLGAGAISWAQNKPEGGITNTIVPSMKNAVQHISKITFTPQLSNGNFDRTNNNKKSVTVSAYKDPTNSGAVLMIDGSFSRASDVDKKNDIGSGASNSSILGGDGNKITNSSQSVIGGGEGNEIDASNTGSANFVGGGKSNKIQNTQRSSVLGGEGNVISAQSSTILGGQGNIIGGTTGGSTIFGENNTVNGANSFAGGKNVTVSNGNTFAWSDGAGENYQPTGNSFGVNATNGLIINTVTIPQGIVMNVAGAIKIGKATLPSTGNVMVACNSDNKGAIFTIIPNPITSFLTLPPLNTVDNTTGHACFCGCDGTQWTSFTNIPNCQFSCQKQLGSGASLYPKCGNPNLVKDIFADDGSMKTYTGIYSLCENGEVGVEPITQWTRSCKHQYKWTCATPYERIDCTYKQDIKPNNCTGATAGLFDADGNALRKETGKLTTDGKKTFDCIKTCKSDCREGWGSCVPSCPEGYSPEGENCVPKHCPAQYIDGSQISYNTVVGGAPQTKTKTLSYYVPALPSGSGFLATISMDNTPEHGTGLWTGYVECLAGKLTLTKEESSYKCLDGFCKYSGEMGENACNQAKENTADIAGKDKPNVWKCYPKVWNRTIAVIADVKTQCGGGYPSANACGTPNAVSVASKHNTNGALEFCWGGGWIKVPREMKGRMAVREIKKNINIGDLCYGDRIDASASENPTNLLQKIANSYPILGPLWSGSFRGVLPFNFGGFFPNAYNNVYYVASYPRGVLGPNGECIAYDVVLITPDKGGVGKCTFAVLTADGKSLKTSSVANAKSLVGVSGI